MIEILKNNFFFEPKGQWNTKISMRKTLRERSVNHVLGGSWCGGWGWGWGWGRGEAGVRGAEIPVTKERKVMEVEYGSHAIL